MKKKMPAMPGGKKPGGFLSKMMQKKGGKMPFPQVGAKDKKAVKRTPKKKPK